MKRLLPIALLAAIVTAPSAALACACCSVPNTYQEYPDDSLSTDLPLLRLTGELGVYGPVGEPAFDIGQSQLTGTSLKGLTKLQVRRRHQLLGELTLKPTARPVHRLTGFDFLLAPADLSRLMTAAPDESFQPPIYHELVVPVGVTADKALTAALGAAFMPAGRLVFHGNGNQCWSPGEPGARWTFAYELKKGGETMPGLARGTVAVPQ